jgi:hypothetical protein
MICIRGRSFLSALRWFASPTLSQSLGNAGTAEGFVADQLLRLASPRTSSSREAWPVTLASSFWVRSMMNKSPLDGSRADRSGVLIASLCFVHCVAGPVLLSFAGLASLINVSEKLELLFLLGSAAMGAIALVPAYRKKHGRLSCLALFASGLLCLLLRRYIGWRAIPIEPVAVALGAGLIIAAHVLNLRFSRRCGCCDPRSETIQYSPSSIAGRNQ